MVLGLFLSSYNLWRMERERERGVGERERVREREREREREIELENLILKDSTIGPSGPI